MGRPELINMLAETAYEAICDRASKMAEQELPGLIDERKRLWLEVGIAAGVTATIKTMSEGGLFK